MGNVKLTNNALPVGVKPERWAGCSGVSIVPKRCDRIDSGGPASGKIGGSKRGCGAKNHPPAVCQGVEGVHEDEMCGEESGYSEGESRPQTDADGEQAYGLR